MGEEEGLAEWAPSSKERNQVLIASQ